MASNPKKAPTAAQIGASLAAPKPAAKTPEGTGAQAAPPSPSPAPRRPDNGVTRGAKPQLEPGQMEQAEFMRATWFATVPHGTQPEALLDPTFWAHHAVRLQPRARVEVWAADGSWMAECVVLDCSRTWAKVVPVIGPVRFTTQDVSLTQAAVADAEQALELEISKVAKGYDVEFNATDKWRVVRKGDKVVMTKMRNQRDEAEKWLRAHALHELGKGKPADEVVPAG
jgi:hypothetical protein